MQTQSWSLQIMSTSSTMLCHTRNSLMCNLLIVVEKYKSIHHIFSSFSTSFGTQVLALPIILRMIAVGALSLNEPYATCSLVCPNTYQSIHSYSFASFKKAYKTPELTKDTAVKDEKDEGNSSLHV